MTVKPIPDGYHSVTPYLMVDGARKVIEFLKDAFDADVQVHMELPGGLIGHAEATIGDSKIMISDGSGKYPAQKTSIYLYVNDVDATYKKRLMPAEFRKWNRQINFTEIAMAE